MATVKDIAREAGVSQPTVSRALNGHAWVSEETRERVMRAAQKLGYRPNGVARSLVRGTTQTVGVIVPTISNSFTAEIVNGIQWICAKKDYRLLLGYSLDRPGSERKVANLLLEHRVDGLICVVNSTMVQETERWLPEAQEMGVICVVVDHRTSVFGVDYVVSDDLVGAIEAVEHLLRLGHTRIGYLSTTAGGSTACERLQGYRTALSAAGIEPDESLIVGYGPRPEDSAQAMETVLDLSKPPTAIFAENDYVLANSLPVLRRRGVRVPEDLALVGFADVDIAHYLGFTTVRQPTGEMGLRAAERLFERLKDPTLPSEGSALPTSLVIRESCGASRKAS